MKKLCSKSEEFRHFFPYSEIIKLDTRISVWTGIRKKRGSAGRAAALLDGDAQLQTHELVGGWGETSYLPGAPGVSCGTRHFSQNLLILPRDLAIFPQDLTRFSRPGCFSGKSGPFSVEPGPFSIGSSQFLRAGPFFCGIWRAFL